MLSAELETAGVGEVANFLIGCAFIVPAGLIYHKKHTRTGALIGMASGTVLMTVIGGLMNAYVLLPVYAKAFGMPLNALVEMGNSDQCKDYKCLNTDPVCSDTV